MGRSTLSHSATFHIHAYALTSASGLAGRQIAAWLCKQVAQAAEWLTSAHATSRFVQLYPGVFKALGFCKKVCKAARGLWNHSPWKISSAVSLFSCLLTKKKKIKQHHCQPCMCWTVEETGCFLHLPALLTKLTDAKEDHVLSCRLGLVDRGREDKWNFRFGLDM